MPFRKKILLSVLIVATIILFAPWQNIFNSQFISWDAAGYYQFLPAAFIYHDFNFFHWVNQALLPYHYIEMGGFIYYGAEHVLLSKYSIGVAILQLPFFLLSWPAAIIFHYRQDGFSFPFQLGSYLSGLFYLALGLRFTYRIIRNYFSESSSIAATLLVLFGTNLFAFGIVTNNFSHLYGFTAIAFFIYSLQQLNIAQSQNNFIRVALVFSLAVLIRNTNIVALVFAFFLLFEKRKIIFNKINWKKILLAFSLAAIPAFIQMLYWKTVTGNWIVVGYFENGEGFNFLHPHLWMGLFSGKKGWFVHTPIAAISLLFIYFLYKKNKTILAASISFLVVWIYVTYSWKVWHYDGGMSSRPMVEVGSVIGIFLAAGLEWMREKKIIRIIFIGAISFFVYLNIIQTWMMNEGIYPNMFSTKADYINSISGIKDFIQFKIILSERHQLKPTVVQNEKIIVDSIFNSEITFIGLSAGRAFKNIFIGKINEKSLHQGDWIRVEGSGFYERKYPLEGNKCYVIFTMEKNGEPYLYQSAEMPINKLDTIVNNHRELKKFSFDFKLERVADENDLLQIYLWNDSHVAYHIASARVKKLKLK